MWGECSLSPYFLKSTAPFPQLLCPQLGKCESHACTEPYIHTHTRVPVSGRLVQALPVGSLTQVLLMKRIAEMIDLQPVLGKLLRIWKHLLSCDSLR